MQGAFLNKGAVFFSFSSLLLHQRPQVGPHRGRKCSRGIRRAGQSLPLAQRASAGENPPPSRTPLTVLRTPLVAQTGSADEQRGGALQSVPSLSAGGKTHCNSPSTDRFFLFSPCVSPVPLLPFRASWRGPRPSSRDWQRQLWVLAPSKSAATSCRCAPYPLLRSAHQGHYCKTVMIVLFRHSRNSNTPVVPSKSGATLCRRAPYTLVHRAHQVHFCTTVILCMDLVLTTIRQWCTCCTHISGAELLL